MGKRIQTTEKAHKGHIKTQPYNNSPIREKSSGRKKKKRKKVELIDVLQKTLRHFMPDFFPSFKCFP